MDAGQLHKLARVLREIALDATADEGEAPVSAGDVAIAEDIAHHERTSVGEIASRTGLAQSLVSRTVAKMDGAGIVVSEHDPADGRRRLISIAPTVRTGLFRSRARRSVEPSLRARYSQAPDLKVARVLALLQELADLLTIEAGVSDVSGAPEQHPSRLGQRTTRARADGE